MESRPVVLVTGGAARIGRCIAEHLAAQGFTIALHYRRSREAADRSVAALQAAGHRAQSFAADLADEAQCESLVPAVVQAFGRIDAVVNNASLFEQDDVQSFTTERMQAHWRANTAPAILLARALHRHGGGVVVNLLDQKLWNPNPDYLSYTLSKAALQAATTLLAQALAPTVRVCGVAPGVTLLSGEMSAAEFEASANDDAARPQLDPRRPGAGGALPDRVARHHRHHAAGRRRPAPAAAGPRRAVHCPRR